MRAVQRIWKICQDISGSVAPRVARRERVMVGGRGGRGGVVVLVLVLVVEVVVDVDDGAGDGDGAEADGVWERVRVLRMGFARTMALRREAV